MAFSFTHICSGTELIGTKLPVLTKSSTMIAATYELVGRLALISTGLLTAYHVIVQSLKATIQRMNENKMS